MVNPCSFLSLETVLDTLLLNKSTEWITVVCDGLPFNLCAKLIENYHTCPTCTVLFKKKSDFVNHNLTHKVDNLFSCQTYGRVLLLPGIGHMENKITKAILNCCGMFV